MKQLQWIAVAVALLVLIAAVIFPPTQSAPPQVSLPDWLMEFERDPFGTKEFQSYSKAFIPLWKQLKQEYADLQSNYLAAPIELTPRQAEEKLAQWLGAQWTLSPRWVSETEWGWSVGYENGDFVYVLLVVNKQSLSDYHSSIVPATIVTNAQLTHALVTNVKSVTVN